MALLRIEFTRVQHRSHTRRVCECQLFLRSVLCDGISCLHQRSSFTLFIKYIHTSEFSIVFWYFLYSFTRGKISESVKQLHIVQSLELMDFLSSENINISVRSFYVFLFPNRSRYWLIIVRRSGTWLGTNGNDIVGFYDNICVTRASRLPARRVSTRVCVETECENAASCERRCEASAFTVEKWQRFHVLRRIP